MEIKQCAEAKAKTSFTASINRQRIHVSAGQVFWIASSGAYAKNYGVVDICRKGKSTRYTFTLEKFNELFDLV